MSKLPPPEWAADEIFTYATKLGAKHRVRLFRAARALSLQPPAQVKRVLIQAYGYYARLGGRTAQVVALVDLVRQHDDLLSYAATNGDSDFVVLPEPRINPAARGGVLVTCKAGDLVLWERKLELEVRSRVRS